MRWWAGARRTKREPSVAAECEAFLAGGWVRYLEAHGEPVPSWSWLNRVAHAGESELRVIAGALGATRRDADEWRQASAFLAAEILDFAETKSWDVAGLQREVLVPLELSLLADPSSRQLTSGQLVVRALAAFPERLGWTR